MSVVSETNVRGIVRLLEWLLLAGLPAATIFVLATNGVDRALLVGAVYLCAMVLVSIPLHWLIAIDLRDPSARGGRR
jgi:hypothetical protein